MSNKKINTYSLKPFNNSDDVLWRLVNPPEQFRFGIVFSRTVYTRVDQTPIWYLWAIYTQVFVCRTRDSNEMDPNDDDDGDGGGGGEGTKEGANEIAGNHLKSCDRSVRPAWRGQYANWVILNIIPLNRGEFQCCPNRAHGFQTSTSYVFF